MALHQALSVTQHPLSTSLSLLDLARHADEEAWRRLCAIYTPLVYGWARRAGLQPDCASDIVQDVFRIVAKRLPDFRGDRPGDTFRGWLLTICRNEIRGHYRRQSRHVQSPGGTTALNAIQQLPDQAADQAEDWYDEQAAQHEVLRRTAEVVRHDFEPRTWQAFWLNVVEEKDSATIADELQMTPNAVRQARFRVLKRLKEMLGEI